jgi:hypothetical protein
MTDNEFERIARDWLEEGPTSMTDRALRSALDEIHATRQRRVIAALRRFTIMGNTFRLAALAAAIVLATVVGVPRLFPSGGGGGSQAPLPTASPSPAPSPRAMTTGDWAPLEPGAHITADPFLARLTFTVPAGWSGNMGGPYAVFLGNASSTDTLWFEVFDDLYADPCHDHNRRLNPKPGPSVDELANALAALPGLEVTPPTDVTLGGYQGKQLTITAPATGGSCRVWVLPLGATNDMAAGDQQRLWILDVDGQRLIIDAPEPPAMTAATKAETQAVLDSIHIEPVATVPGSPSPAAS